MHSIQRIVGIGMDMGMGRRIKKNKRFGQTYANLSAGHKKNVTDILDPNPTSGNQSENEYSAYYRISAQQYVRTPHTRTFYGYTYSVDR